MSKTAQTNTNGGGFVANYYVCSKCNWMSVVLVSKSFANKTHGVFSKCSDKNLRALFLIGIYVD